MMDGAGFTNVSSNSIVRKIEGAMTERERDDMICQIVASAVVFAFIVVMSFLRDVRLLKSRNLIRSELTPVQRAKLTAQRKGAYQDATPADPSGR
jgi:hypothetical protein